MNRKTLLATAIAVTLSTGFVMSAFTPVFAQDGKTEQAATDMKDQVAEKDLIAVSKDALLTMRAIRAARLAIFNGMPDKARIFTDAATARVAAALKDVDKYALDIKKPLADGEEYVPFDASMAVVESEVIDEEKTKQVAKAKEHLKKGETKKAIEVLKLGEIEVALTTRMVPLKAAEQGIASAVKLIGEGKYYEANMALKAVEDAVLVETFGVDAVPKAKGHS